MTPLNRQCIITLPQRQQHHAASGASNKKAEQQQSSQQQQPAAEQITLLPLRQCFENPSCHARWQGSPSRVAFHVSVTVDKPVG